jgi:hypothetical protein
MRRGMVSRPMPPDQETKLDLQMSIVRIIDPVLGVGYLFNRYDKVAVAEFV